jgi:chromosome partitioning protein
MQIAVIAKKGGVGKTTLCILLHEAIRQTGQRVAVRDFDAQGSATKALKRFGGTAEVPGEKYDVLLIDSPPSLTMSATAAAVSAAQIILIPTSPSPAGRMGGRRNGRLRPRQERKCHCANRS